MNTSCLSCSFFRIRALVLSVVCLNFLGHAVLADRPPEEVLNVDFNSTASGQLSPTFAGLSPLGGGVFWNGVNGSAASLEGPMLANSVVLLQSDGQTESDVQISRHGFTGVNTFLNDKDGTTPSALHNNALLVDLITTVRGSDPGELSISGLKPNTSYDLVLFGRSPVTGTRFTVDGLTLETSGVGPGDLPLEEKRDYVQFPSISSGDNGEIIIRAEGTSSGAHLAGFSIAPSQ